MGKFQKIIIQLSVKMDFENEYICFCLVVFQTRFLVCVFWDTDKDTGYQMQIFGLLQFWHQ